MQTHVFPFDKGEMNIEGISYFSTTVPISMQVFSAALRNSGSGCATFIKSAYERKKNDSLLTSKHKKVQ